MNVNKGRDIDNSQSNSNVSCNICVRGITTDRRLLLHLNACRRKQEQLEQQLEANKNQEKRHRLQDKPHEPLNESFYRNEKPGTTLVNKLKNAYYKIVYWRKLVSSPSRVSGRFH